MSTQIDTSLTNLFHQGVEVQFQQMESRLRPRVRNEQQRGEFGFFDRVESTTVQKVVSRHSDTPLINTPHSRRRVAMNSYVWADLIDDEDLVRTINDPQNAYVVNAAAAMSRQQDQEIIDAAFGTAQAGKSGSTAVSFPASNILTTTATDTLLTGGAASNLNVAKLRHAGKLLKANEAILPGERLYCAITASQEQALLREVEVTSMDFSNQKFLNSGSIDGENFMGFQFIRTELLAVAGTPAVRDCIAWAETGLLLAAGMEIQTRVSERNDKNHSTQVFLRFTAGSTRLWEEKVIQIQCDETT